MPRGQPSPHAPMLPRASPGRTLIPHMQAPSPVADPPAALSHEAVVYQGHTLPAPRLRFCSADFRDDAFYLRSAIREADRLIERCGLAPHSALLDIGCGQGRLAIGILARSRELWPQANHGAAGIKRYEGVDVSAGAIDWCRRHLGAGSPTGHPSFRFTHLDARNARYNPGGSTPLATPLPFDDETFDVINLYSVFTHLLTEDVDFYLREIARLLAPRGRAFCTAYIEPGVEDVAENPEGYRGPSNGPLHRVRYSTEFFSRLVAAAGLRIDRLDHAAELDGQSGVYLSRVLTPPPTPTGRRLEIGPGASRVPGFETFNVVPGPDVDHVGDAARALPFPDNTFALIYASHILEHIPWYQTVDALREWFRVLAPGGALEVWVPDGLKICRAFVEAESGGEDRTINDGWYRFNPQRDPCVWAAGRIFTYGDGDGNPASPNWHRAIFSPRHLENCLRAAGFERIERLPRAHVRGDDHGWINLGMRGVKPASAAGGGGA